MDSKRILVVDDDKITRVSVTDFCKKNGIKVDEADSGKKGIEFVSANKYSMIIIDKNMPGLNGFETATKMKEVSNEALPELIIISSDIISPKEYSEYGFTDYIEKPITKKSYEILLKKLMK